ncbi:MAG: ABC transporter substrate-binding protein [Deltaproteobacteria bacterium]|nr:ABC transporter substrate-binding protein [Deltaproteobacteria bacterium]
MSANIRFKSPVLVLAAVVFAIGCKDRGGDGGGDGRHSKNHGPRGGDGEILVGEYGSMTGSTATFGVETHNGIQIAVDETNEAGGVKGRKLRLISLDDQGKSDEAVTTVTRLIDLDHVVAVLGEVASSRSKVGARVCQRKRVPMVTPSSTNPEVTKVGDYIFRVCFIDPFQGLVMAKFARTNLGLTKVAILRDVRNDYSVGLADAFKEAFGRLGGTVVSDLSYNEGDTDFSAQLTTIKTAGPQAIFVPGYYTEVGNIAVQSKRLGLDVPLLGGDGWDSPQLVEIGGEALNGSYFSNHYSAERATPTAQRFIDEYRRRYHETPSGLAALGYDAAKILFDAMGRATTIDGPTIRDALASTRGFDGVTGNITIDAGRNAVKPAVVLKIEGGKYEYVATIEP